MVRHQPVKGDIRAGGVCPSELPVNGLLDDVRHPDRPRGRLGQGDQHVATGIQEEGEHAMGPVVLLPEHVADFVLHVQQSLKISPRPGHDPVPGLVLTAGQPFFQKPQRSG